MTIAAQIRTTIAQNVLELFSGTAKKNNPSTNLSNLSSSRAQSAQKADTLFLSPKAKTVQKVKDIANTLGFNDGVGRIDPEKIRTMVSNGEIPPLAKLEQADIANLTPAEKDLYALIESWQNYYNAQPQTVDEALENYKKIVIESYPESITRMKNELASGKLDPKDGWEDVIASYESELSAATEGRMEIRTVNDPKLVYETGAYKSKQNAFGGWDLDTPNTQADIPALQKLCGTNNVCAGISPNFGAYVISW